MKESDKKQNRSQKPTTNTEEVNVTKSRSLSEGQKA